jgi:hypothetical protein
MKYKIIDNFLNKEEFEKIKDIVTGVSFPWFYQKQINPGHAPTDKTCYFTHMAFNQSSNSFFFEHCSVFTKKLKVKSYLRIKLNCFPSTEKIRINELHQDFEFKHKAALYYINTNDGFTLLSNNIKIESIENRMLLFEAHKLHSSTTCTNQKARFNININYF